MQSNIDQNLLSRHTDITDTDALNAEIRHNDSYPPTNLGEPHQDHENLDEGVMNKDIKGRKVKSKLNQQDTFDPLVPNMPEPLRIAQLGYLTRP